MCEDQWHQFYSRWVEMKDYFSKSLGVQIAFPTLEHPAMERCACRCMSSDFGIPHEPGRIEAADLSEVLVEPRNTKEAFISEEEKQKVMKTIEKFCSFITKSRGKGSMDELQVLDVRHPNLLKLQKVVLAGKGYALVWDTPGMPLRSLLTVAVSKLQAPLLAPPPGGDGGSGGGGGPPGRGPAAVSADGDLRRRFLAYQLLRALEFLHARGLPVADLARSVAVAPDLWVQVWPSVCPLPLPAGGGGGGGHGGGGGGGRGGGGGGAGRARLPPPPSPWAEAPGSRARAPLSALWCRGQVSNFEYLMAVNRAAGRSMGDSALHPVFPWVSNLLVRGGGWRDLGKTKFRLTKGDAQLDTTFLHGAPPHHVPESLSDITYHIYMARRTPLAVLRAAVRATFVAEHYPSTIARLYEWSPDEAIPEFYFDPSAFRSLHAAHGLPDLGVPSWCESAEDFVHYHRSLLESDYVSENLPQWLDLTFGACLSGQLAITNKNVPLWATEDGSKSTGFVQLFHQKHPRKMMDNQQEMFDDDGLSILEEPHPMKVSSQVSKLLQSDSFFTSLEQVLGGSSDNPFEWLENLKSIGKEAPTIPETRSGNDYDEQGRMAPSVDLVKTVQYFEEYEKAEVFSTNDGSLLDALYCLPGEKLSNSSNIFSAGCLLAELYLGKPFLYAVRSQETEDKEGLNLESSETTGTAVAFNALDTLPPAVIAAVSEMTAADPAARPSAAALLRAAAAAGPLLLGSDDPPGGGRELSSSEEGEGGGGGDGGGGSGGGGAPAATALFPRYFEEVYGYLHALHAVDSRTERLLMTTSCLPKLLEDLPLDGFLLILPCLLDFLNSPEDFFSTPPPRSDIKAAAVLSHDSSIRGHLKENKKRKVLSSALNHISKKSQPGSWRDSILIFEAIEKQTLQGPDVLAYNLLLGSLSKANKFELVDHYFRKMKQYSLRPDTYSYNAVVKTLAKQGQIPQCMELLEEAEQSGLLLNNHLFSSVLTASQKTGDSDSARMIINVMLSKGIAPDVITFSGAISACEKGNDAESAFSIYDVMEKCNVQPNAYTYSALIKACRGDSMLWKRASKLVHEVQLPAIEIYNAAISTCGEFSFDEAFNIFKLLQSKGIKPDVLTFNSLISSCEKAGRYDEAILLLDKMRSFGVLPDRISFNSAIAACANAAKPDLANVVFGRMKKEGFHPDSYSYNGVLLALSRAGDFEQTIKTLKEMARYGVQPDVLSFLCAIDAARRSRRAHLAFSLFHTMKKAKIKPSRQIFTSLIRCCAHIDKKAPGTHDTTQSFLAVPWKTAMLLLDEMKELGVTPDVHTYASLLSVLATFSKSKEAQVIFQEMIHNGITPNEYCLFNMMQVYAKIDDWERCVEVFYHVTGLGATADESCYKLVLNTCLKLSNTEVQAKTAFDVLQFFQRDNSSSMSNLKTGDGQNLRKTELYNLGLKCCEQTGNFKAAKEILQMMKRTGVEQDIISLNRAIGACQASGAHKQALDLLKEVQESSDSLLRPNVFTYTAVMRVYIKAGLYSEVKKLLLLSQAAAKDTADYPLTITSKAETKGMLHIAAIQAFHSAGMYEYAETVFKNASDLELFGNEILASIENSYSQDSPAVVIDLHGYVLPVAHMAIRRAMSEVLGVAQHCQQSVKPIEIVTGSGKHSINNKPVLRPEIQNMLVEEFFPPIYTSTKPGNSGRIIITTDSILEWLSHTAEAKNNIMMGLKVVLEQQIEKKKGDGCSH